MFQVLKNKLQKIQESDESVKKGWLIIMSALSMVVIVALWIILFNNFMGQIEIASNEQIDNISFWQTFHSGLKSIGGSSWDEIKNLYNQIMGEMFINVE